MNPISAARRARGLSLSDIAARTRICLRYVEAIDEGRTADLPAGLYGRSYVRSIAAVVGVAEAELEDILAPLAPAPDPLPIIKEMRAPRWEDGDLLEPLREHAAAAMDAVVLLGVDVAILEVVAAACGVSPRALMSLTPGPLLVLGATTWLVYFALFAGVHGSTPGQMAFGISFGHAHPLRLAAIARRTIGIGEATRLRPGDEAPAGLRPSTAGPASPA